MPAPNYGYTIPSPVAACRSASEVQRTKEPPICRRMRDLKERVAGVRRFDLGDQLGSAAASKRRFFIDQREQIQRFVRKQVKRGLVINKRDLAPVDLVLFVLFLLGLKHVLQSEWSTRGGGGLSMGQQGGHRWRINPTTGAKEPVQTQQHIVAKQSTWTKNC